MAEITAFAIKELASKGLYAEAAIAAASLIREEAGLEVERVEINQDRYSLNSVNGTVYTEKGEAFFFKFHTEEDEAETINEYYQANILAEAGLPVDLPVKASTKPGRQFLLYAYRHDRKLADICLSLEQGEASAFTADQLLAAQRELDRLASRVAVSTLSPPTAASQAEPIHQLFHHRLVDRASRERLGGRYRQFYLCKRFSIAERELDWETFENLHWIVNDVEYRLSLRELFLQSCNLLHPAYLAAQPVIVSHGDAHNANIWVSTAAKAGYPRLTFFDPAFAGKNIPALLGEIKATFHNIFAHPFWLYTPDLAGKAFNLSARLEGERIVVKHNWALGTLRRGFLRSKLENYWQPLLAALVQIGHLADDWETIMRSALFCCPTLVMSLLPDEKRSAATSLLGFAIAIACGSPSAQGWDDVSDFFARCRGTAELASAKAMQPGNMS